MGIAGRQIDLQVPWHMAGQTDLEVLR